MLNQVQSDKDSSVFVLGKNQDSLHYFIGFRFVPVQEGETIVEIPLVTLDEYTQLQNEIIAINSFPIDHIIKAQEDGYRFVSNLTGRTLPKCEPNYKLNVVTLKNSQRYAVLGTTN